MRLLAVAAVAKIAVGVAVSVGVPLAALRSPGALPAWYYAGLLLAFGASGLVLWSGGTRDSRARLLGLVFLLFGSLFTDRLALRAMPELSGPVAFGLWLATSAQIIAFNPYVLWRFAWEFPRVLPTLLPPWLPPLFTRVSFAAAAALFAGNLIRVLLAPTGSALEQLLGRLAPDAEGELFWRTLAVLDLPPLALLALKLRAAREDERRRLVWLVAGITVGTLPMVAHVLLDSVVPPYAAFSATPAGRRALAILLTASSLAIPAAAAYAVIVDQVLAVRFVMRRALQYALARYTVLSVMAALLAAIAWVGYGNRARPLQELATGSPLPAAALVVLVAILFGRRPLLDAIDRRYFREQYDARRILVRLVDTSQQAQTARELASLITAEIDRALHLERASLLVCSDDGATFRDPSGRVRDLDTRGALGALILGDRTSLDVDLRAETSPLGRLPESEREWLIDAGARLIVPLFGVRSTPIGILTLGDKRSELPFTQEDRQLMMAVAASAALALEQRLNRESPDPDVTLPTAAKSLALQCVVCGRVQSRELTPPCHSCGGPVQEALLPAVLAGKFEIERQIGSGGMGVVYRALDLSLGRPVAIKVLPRLAPQAAARLRREARAMAVLQHPNLAVIHALESWRGQPVLVLEYLSGGTLADRLRSAPLRISELVSTGLVIADVLRHVHAGGFLHRDLKPSNIGFTGDGTPKLLDFGLVRLVTTASQTPSASTTANTWTIDTAPSRADSAQRSLDSSVHRFVGTPAYMSPEALALDAPTQGVDLWGLALTLYEALTGSNPFAAPTLAETSTLIMQAALPDPRDLRPDCPPALAAFFASALAANRWRRPQTAVEFSNQLRNALASP
jgi:hypothetical protein